MDLVLLGGNHPGNQEWLEAVAAKLGDLFDQTWPLIYQHWRQPELTLDLEREVDKLARLTRSLHDYAIFAKSAGIAITLTAYQRGLIKPNLAVFVGLPIGWGGSAYLEAIRSVKQRPLPILFIQNRADPLGPADKVKDWLSKIDLPDYKLVILPGQDHIYADLPVIRQKVKEFLSPTSSTKSK